MQNSPEPSGGARRGMRLALIGSVLLVVAGLATFTYASRAARHGAIAQAASTGNTGHANAASVTVTVRDGQCDPAQLSVPAGRTVFTIVNQSARAVEWEILDGVMVLEERENIAPGFSQTLTAKLSPGTFQITCGLLSNPRGTLTVTPSADSILEAAKPPVSSFVGPLAEYRVYTVLEAGSLLASTQALVQAIQAGDLAQARTLLGPAHQAYEHIAPVADMFADLDTRIDARAAYFEKREADPAFGGFQRMAYELARPKDAKDLAAVATQLLADVQTLHARLRGLQLQPERLGAAAARSVQKFSGAAPDTDTLADLPNQLQGVQKIVDVLRPLLTRAKPGLLAAIDADLAALAQTGAAHTPQAMTALQSLGQNVARINPALGLE